MDVYLSFQTNKYFFLSILLSNSYSHNMYFYFLRLIRFLIQLIKRPIKLVGKVFFKR